MNYKGTFVKIDPIEESITVSKTLVNTKKNAANYFEYRGDFMPTDNAEDEEYHQDAFQNSYININGDLYRPDIIFTKGRIINISFDSGEEEGMTFNNSDPDNDYGIYVVALPFSDEADTFSFYSSKLPEKVIDQTGYILLNAGDGDDNVRLWNADSVYSEYFGSRKFYGGNGNDTINAGNGGNSMSGGKGNDTITGGMKRDYLYGDDGDDVLAGRGGSDILYGGAGKDVFSFKHQNDSTVSSTGRDLVKDFTRSQGDKVDLATIDANRKVSGNQDFTFIGTAKYSKTAGELRYEQKGGDTYVYGDTDGDGRNDFSIRFDTEIAFIKSDFYL